jgi:hypothetical protein
MLDRKSIAAIALAVPLKEVGLQFSVTLERIRQIEAKALRKLKHPSRSRVLSLTLANFGSARESVFCR